MNGNINIFLSFIISVLCSTQATAKTNPTFASHDIYFIENKGQVNDQFGNPRNDIRYSLQAPGINVFIGGGQLHYEFLKRDVCGAVPSCGVPGLAGILPPDVSTYRMDVELVGANNNAEVTATEEQDYYEIYFPPGSPVGGIKAHTYKKITCKNVYPDIDWVICIKGNKLEHEFVVGPSGDATQIKLKYSGASSLKINADGSIAATTPMGIIKEHAPVCYKAGFPGEGLEGAFKLNGNIISYEVNNNNKYKGGLVIDPAVEWGTYYGPATSTSPVYDVTCDAAANVYICGLTYSATLIATTGAFADTLSGETDGYLVKFDSSGHRLWGTYYGNSSVASGTWGTADAGTWASAVACDPGGNIYLSGSTGCNAGIATPGASLETYMGGEWVGYLVKFNSSGSREWCTYFGGSPGNAYDIEISSVICDSSWHVYVSGTTDDSSNIGTPGAWKPSKATGPDTTINDFLIRFDTAGVKQWGTYYGADYRNQSYTGAACSDGVYVYLSGWTNDTAINTIGSVGSYMPNYGGGETEAFLAKFDATGNRIWGTYYGDTSRADDTTQETTGGVTCDINGYIYVLGNTTCAVGIATPGSSQPLYGGNTDAFLAKFDPETGNRIWGTYYGGPGVENTTNSRIASDNSGNVYITGNTTSATGIASSGAWQAAYGGGPEDAFLAAYKADGTQQWGTYLGGNGEDWGVACAIDRSSSLYLCGRTNSTNNIATPDGFLPTGGDITGLYFQGYLVKFADVALATAPKIPATRLIIYPSPNTGAFTLSGPLNTGGDVNIIVTDMAGRIILNDKADVSNRFLNKQIIINESAPPGAYLLKVISQDEVNVLRFVKE